MDLKRLEYFAAVAEADSLTAAAVRMRISQPALSRQISLLEDELGVKLFLRQRRGVLPTKEGQDLYSRIQAPLREIDNALRITRSGSSRKQPSLVIWISVTVGQLLVGPLIRRIAAEAPEIAIRIADGSTGKISDMLIRQELDMALVYGPPEAWKGSELGHVSDIMNQEAVLEEELVVLGAAASAPLSKGEITIGEVAGLPLVLPSHAGQYLHYKQLMSEIAARKDRKSPSITESDSIEQSREMLLSGRAFTIAPLSFAAEDIRKGLLAYAPIQGLDLMRPLMLLTRKDSAFPAAIATAKQAVLSEIRRLVHEGAWHARLVAD